MLAVGHENESHSHGSLPDSMHFWILLLVFVLFRFWILISHCIVGISIEIETEFRSCKNFSLFLYFSNGPATVLSIQSPNGMKWISANYFIASDRFHKRTLVQWWWIEMPPRTESRHRPHDTLTPIWSQQNNSKNWFFIKDIIFWSIYLFICTIQAKLWQTNWKIHHYNQIVPFDCWWLKRQDVRFWHRLRFQTAFNQNIWSSERIKNVEKDEHKSLGLPNNKWFVWFWSPALNFKMYLHKTEIIKIELFRPKIYLIK